MKLWRTLVTYEAVFATDDDVTEENAGCICQDLLTHAELDNPPKNIVASLIQSKKEIPRKWLNEIPHGDPDIVDDEKTCRQIMEEKPNVKEENK